MSNAMKKRATLQHRARTPDGGGGFSETWTDVASVPEVYAEIVPLSGSEQLRYHQLSTVVTHRITLRYRSDVTADMRLVSGGRVYNIVSAVSRDDLWLDILATEGG